MRNWADDGSLNPLLYLHRWEEDWINLGTICWSIPHVISQHSHSVAACWMGHLARFFYYWLKDFLPCPTCTEPPWPLSALLSSSIGDQPLTQELGYRYTKVLLSSKTKLSSQYPSSRYLTLFWHIELMISESCRWWFLRAATDDSEIQFLVTIIFMFSITYTLFVLFFLGCITLH